VAVSFHPKGQASRTLVIIVDASEQRNSKQRNSGSPKTVKRVLIQPVLLENFIPLPIGNHETETLRRQRREEKMKHSQAFSHARTRVEFFLGGEVLLEDGNAQGGTSSSKQAHRTLL
jgi:hypothetical protein